MPAANVARLGVAFQTAKGAAAANPLFWLNFTGGNIRPAPESERRSETGLGRDVGDLYIRVLGINGDPSVLLRPDSAAFLYQAVLGTRNTTGASNPFTHTTTGANDQPWVTVWKEHGDSIWEKYTDCKITSLNVEFAAGGDLAASMNIFGLGYERLTAAPSGGSPVHDQETPLRVPGAVYSIGGSPDNTITQGNINIEAAQTPIQTNAIGYSYLVPGTRTIEWGYEGVYEDVTRYAQVYTGSGSGTALATTIFESNMVLTFGDFTAGPGIRFTITPAHFTQAEPSLDPGGAPMTLSVGGAVKRGAVFSVAVMNDRAGTFYAAA